MKRFSPSVRQLAWAGGLVIAALAGQAVYEIWQGYREALRWTERELSAQARVVAEQTARSVQAMDVTLRHIAERVVERPALMQDTATMDRLMRDKAQGLVQSDGLVLIDPQGNLKIVSQMKPEAISHFNVAHLSPFNQLSVRPGGELLIDQVRASPGTGRWVFPIGLRIEAPDGRFLGVVGAQAKVDYFQDFYREGFGTQRMRIALVHRKGWLLARNPPAPQSLGKNLDVVHRLLPADSPVQAAFERLPSPVDGDDHFAALHRVPDYPLIVVAARDYTTALEPWRRGAVVTAQRTAALCLLASLLLWLALRQLSRAQRARQALQVSEQRYALAAAGSDMGLWDWDLDSGTAFVSRRARQLLGLALSPELEPMAEVRDRLAIHAQDRAAFDASLEAHLRGHSPAFDIEYRVPEAEGEAYRWVHVRALCTRGADGRAQRLAGSVSDIDQRKRAEQALQQSEERYALAMAGSRAGHWVWNVATDELFVSEQYHELVGLPPDSAVRSREDFFAAVDAAPEDIARVRELSIELVQGSREQADHEFRIRTPQGERWVLTRAKRFADAAGGLRVAGVSVDVTERKQAELEHQRLEEQLRQAQKLEAIGTLAGGIAHDFNNILAGILGYGEMAQKEAPPDSRLRRHIDAALAAGLRARSLVERILAFSRSGLGQRVPVHVQSVVREALDALETSLPAGVRLQARLEAGDAGVMGDPTQIHQVVMNLCLNAAQAMKAGGSVNVSLDVITRSEPLAVATARLAPGDYLRLSVEDSGAGMPTTLLERIFDPFFTTKEIGVGTGLGLSLVHGIVGDLGGGIDVSSRLGEGSCFTVYLPLRAEGSVARPAPRAAAVEPGQGECVMVVDDEETLVRLAEEMLAELGYEPVGFTSAQAALDGLRTDPARFDLLLSDEAMPGMTGTQLIAQARELAPDLRVLMMSGFVTPGLQQRARELGVLQVLNKPLLAAEIAAALATALRASRRRTNEQQP